MTARCRLCLQPLPGDGYCLNFVSCNFRAPAQARDVDLAGEPRAGVDQWFQRCIARAGLTRYTMHQLRHATIDDLSRRTGSAERARQLARHENVQVTQDYLHSDVDDSGRRSCNWGRKVSRV